MDYEALLARPLPGFTLAKTGRYKHGRAGLLQRLGGYRGGARVVWIAQSLGSQVKGVEFILWSYDHASLPEYVARKAKSSAVALSKRVQAQSTTIVRTGQELLSWSSGDLRFTAFSGPLDAYLIGGVAVSSKDSDATPVIEAAVGSIISGLPASPRFPNVPPLIRQLLVCSLPGIAALLFLVAVGEIVGDTAQAVALAGFLAYVVIAYFVLPRLRASQRLERVVAQGDQDGTLRRALENIDVHLP